MNNRSDRRSEHYEPYSSNASLRSSRRRVYEMSDTNNNDTSTNTNTTNNTNGDTNLKESDHHKSIGNRHMAQKDYQAAYESYSTAISLSPLGPSSHIYLSNRAAALLSLKRYSAASVDARRAITLAPTFGKAHARLGQSLYFCKDYAGAVAAYENAFQFEPDNAVTWTYLNKAKKKLEREMERRKRREESQREERRGEREKLALKEVRSQRTVVERRKERVHDRDVERKLYKYSSGSGSGEYHDADDGRNYEYDDTDDNSPAKTDDGASVTDTVDLADMSISVADNDGMGPGVGVLAGIREDDYRVDVDNPNVNLRNMNVTGPLGPDDEDGQFRQSHPTHTHTHSNGTSAVHRALDNEKDRGPLGHAYGSLSEDADVDDPDFDEALRLQESATRKLSVKHYRYAVEEFSAALFLVPDDDNLTPQLYVGRAHALNGQMRHDGALNDAMMALGRNPEYTDAHVVLARSYFYLKDWSEAVASFENARDCLGGNIDGGDMKEINLSPLDMIYWEKANEYLEAASIDGAPQSHGNGGYDGDDRSGVFSISRNSTSKPVPKLKPPRFVSRQELLKSTSNVPPMPKAWTSSASVKLNLPQLPTALRVGKERKVIFHSDQLGVKLNRGADGIVRILSIAPPNSDRNVKREGEIQAGDILREAAGVDLRRPLTNVMWSDTVALLKISPRPLVVLVAREHSAKPVGVKEEFQKVEKESFERSLVTPVARNNSRSSTSGTTTMLRLNPPPFASPPSCANGEESVKDSMEMMERMNREVELSMSARKLKLSQEERDIVDAQAYAHSNSNSNIDADDDIDANLEVKEKDDQESVEVTDTTMPEMHESSMTPKKTIEEPILAMQSESKEKAVAKHKTTQEEPMSDPTTSERESGGEEGVEMKVSNHEDSSSHSITIEDENKEELETEIKEKSSALEEVQDESSNTLANELDMLVIDAPDKVNEDTCANGEDPMDEKKSTACAFRIIFPRPKSSASQSPAHVYGGFTKASWKEAENTRQLVFCGEVTRYEKGRFFWSNGGYVPRTLILFENPHILVIARAPTNAGEVRGSLREDLAGRKLGVDPLRGVSDEETLKTYLVAESIVDLKTCKLRLSTLTTPTSLLVDPDGNDADAKDDVSISVNPRRISCFELITPTENIYLSTIKMDDTDADTDTSQADNALATFSITSRWEKEISDALLAAHDVVEDEDDSGLELTWRHQMILGTLHSHVVTGNYSLLEQSLQGKGAPHKPYRGVDIRDKSGLTALHYACLRRSSKSLTLLLGAGADCSLVARNGLKSPSHICAEHLDEKCLSTILSSSLPHRADPNALDENLETPMYVALKRGKSLNGKVDANLLRMCLKVLETWGGQLCIPLSDNDCEQDSMRPHPIYGLSRQWESTSLDIVFDFCPHRYPVVGEVAGGYGRSLAAMYQYPLHTCLIALREKVAAISNIENERQFNDGTRASILETLQVILDKGFEPNERIEVHSTHIPIVNEMSGFAPLQILAVAALDLLDKANSLEQSKSNQDLQIAAPILSSCAEMLVRNGAHVFADSPTSADRLNRGPPKKVKKQKSQDIENVVGSTFILRQVDRSDINMEKNKDLLRLLGGADRLASARAKYQKVKSIDGKGIKQSYLQGKGLSIKVDDCPLPGGSDDKSCAICWKKFGAIRNRKHICRASKKYCCEDCSGRTVVIDGDPRRVSDGQFNMLKFELGRKVEQDRVDKVKHRKDRVAQIERMRAARSPYGASKIDANTNAANANNRLRAVEKDEDAAKQNLFGNIGKSLQNFFMEEVEVEKEQDSSKKTNDNVAGVMSALGQTRQAFNERGEKLNTLVEKTAALNNASEDFAKMARELKESQEKGIFGW